MKSLRPSLSLRHAVIAGSIALLPFAAAAQSNTANGAAQNTTTGYSWLPYTHNGYIGINLGESRFDHEDCVFGFDCNDRSDDLAGKLYLGGMFNPNFGVEVGYINVGKQKMNGGDRKAQGANISLVGNIPLDRWNIFGKVGSTYSWTKTSAAVGPTGDESGFGLSYGAGVGFDITPQSQVVVEWDRNRMDFANQDNVDVDLYTVGYRYRF